jgi:hypothetical protein
MVLTWFAGVHGLNTGFSTASFLRSGTIPDLATAVQRTGTMAEVLESAGIQALQAMLAHSRVTFPLSVAEVILSGLLVIASGLAMGGRRGARGLALQAIAANAALAILAFALTPFVRTAYIDGVLKVAAGLTLPAPQREVLSDAGLIQWAFRIKLAVFDLGVLALGALALTRGRTKQYFEAMARAADRAEEEP